MAHRRIFEAGMKHATAETLAQISSLLGRLRRLPNIVERRPGVFYVRGKAFLHFHEDPAGIFADIKVGDDWKRFAIKGAHSRTEFLKLAARRATGTGARPQAASPKWMTESGWRQPRPGVILVQNENQGGTLGRANVRFHKNVRR